MKIAQFMAQGPRGQAYEVTVDALTRGPSVEVEYVIFTLITKERGGVTITFNPGENTAQAVALDSTVSGYALCLIGCGVGHIVEQILDCRRQGHTAPRSLLVCLASKGIDVTQKLVACAASCLAGAS